MIELEAVDRFISKCTIENSDINTIISNRLYAEVGPKIPVCPMIVYIFQTGNDINVVNAQENRAATTIDCVVKAITTGSSFLPANALMDLVDHQIRSNYYWGDYNIQGAWRTKPIRYTEDLQGVRYYHQGGMYRFWGSN